MEHKKGSSDSRFLSPFDALERAAQASRWEEGEQGNRTTQGEKEARKPQGRGSPFGRSGTPGKANALTTLDNTGPMSRFSTK